MMSKFYYFWYKVFLSASRAVFTFGYKIDSLTNSARRLSERWNKN